MKEKKLPQVKFGVESVLFIVFFIIISSLKSQQNFNARVVFLEIGGSGGVGSINYEHAFYKKNKTDLTWRAGLSFAPVDRNNGIGIVFPVMINTLYGKSSHKFEFGVGQGITVSTRGRFFVLATAALGYRYQSEKKMWFYKVAYTPLISYIVDRQWQHWGGISIGYILNKDKK